MTPEDIARRIGAKRNNERVKLVATALNAIGIATVGAAIIIPSVSSVDFLFSARPWILLCSPSAYI